MWPAVLGMVLFAAVVIAAALIASWADIHVTVWLFARKLRDDDRIRTATVREIRR
jgi:hypothetical protein